MNLRLSDLLAPSWVARQINLHVPPGYYPCNPSVVLHDGKLLALVRCVNYYMSDNACDTILPPQNIIRTRNFLAELGSSLETELVGEVFTGSLEERSHKVIGLEDARIYSWHGQLWAIGAVRQTNTAQACEQIAGIIDDKLNFNWRRRYAWPVPMYNEKNWMPIGDGGFVYSCNPTIVMDCNGRILSLTQPVCAVGKLRGGSAFIPFGDGYLGIAHEVWHRNPGPWRYRQQFIYLECDNEGAYHLTKASPYFWFGHHPRVEFAGGLARHPDGHRLVITYGVMDHEAWVATVWADEVEAILSSSVNI